MARIGLFAFTGLSAERPDDAHVTHFLESLRPHVDHLIAVLPPDVDGTAGIAAIADRVIIGPATGATTGEAYRAGLAQISDAERAGFDELLLADSSSMGPLFPLAELFTAMAGRGGDGWAVTAFNPRVEKQTPWPLPGEAFPRWNFMVLKRAAFQSDAFRSFWPKLAAARPRQRPALAQEAGFAAALRAAGFVLATFADDPSLRSADARLHESWKLIDRRCPFLPYELFTLDPMAQDAQALQSRRTLDLIRERTDYDVGLIWQSLMPRRRLRDLTTNLDLLTILPEVRDSALPQAWNLGRVAVLLHLYYPEMISEFLPLLANIPVAFDLFITTASAEAKAHIEARLKDFGPGRAEVRVVEQNRGRDMSALFIGLRDVVLSGDYQLALRLHSKRSPQMAAQVSDSFMEHLTGNLVGSRALVCNLFDLFDREPQIGLVMPPIVHIGLFTLGHAWFANREPCERIAKQLGFTAPFDEETPVAPYGSMFWFRCAALKPLFAHPWKWEDYNPEPHYIDGDLSHAQERIIAYAAQAAGFRTETVLSARLAGRYYAKLEYKLQLLSSTLPTGKFARQYATAQGDMMRRNRLWSRPRLAKAMADASKRLRAENPALWEKTRPIADRFWPWIKKLLNFH